MSEMREITQEELEELRGYVKEFNPNEGYIFISYAHRDKNYVYPKVLEWMRKGYNIYIDMDFEHQGSEANWVNQMKTHIGKRKCKLAVCFASVNYTFSYASFIELLTMKSRKIKDKRGGTEVPIDIIGIDKVWNNRDGVEDNYEANKDFYERAFDEMKAKMGASFLDANTGEQELFKEGIISWKAGDKNAAEDIIENFKSNYIDGAFDFYCYLATTVNDWFKMKDLNGNYLKLDSDMEARFKVKDVYKRESKNAPEPTSGENPDTENLVYFMGATADTVVLSKKDVTIQEVREMCLSPEKLSDFKKVRSNMPHGGMGAMDYAIAAILGGCNQVTRKSPAYQINYYSYVISKPEDSSKKNDGGLGATWTWSSNCRKALGLEKSGQIPKEINDYFAGLDNHTTLGELEAKFREGAEEPFSTKKNDLVILAIQNIREFMNR